MKQRTQTHFRFENRNVRFGSRRHQKIGIWLETQARKKQRRAAKRAREVASAFEAGLDKAAFDTNVIAALEAMTQHLSNAPRIQTAVATALRKR